MQHRSSESEQRIEIRSPADTTTAQAKRWYQGAEEVFWETSVVSSFETRDARDAFQHKYLSYYYVHEPDLFLVALAPDARILGYICGVADTRAHPELYRIASHIPVFDDLYQAYPAHLHINITAAGRGYGLGGQLISAFETRLRDTYRSPGLHLVTSEGARNTTFYRKNGFTREEPRGLPETTASPEGGAAQPRMLFMGKQLRDRTNRQPASEETEKT